VAAIKAILLDIYAPGHDASISDAPVFCNASPSGRLFGGVDDRPHQPALRQQQPAVLPDG